MKTSMELAGRRVAQADERWRAALDNEGAEAEKDMGAMERNLLRDGREMQRVALAKKLQKKANDTPPRCPVCGAPLKAVQWRLRKVLSRFGEVSFERAYGQCPECKRPFAPADHALGLEGRGGNSPEMAEQLRLLGTVIPPGQAERLSEKLYGFRVDDNRIADELERGGQEAIAEDRREDERALDTRGRWEVTEEIRGDLPAEFVMIIQTDGFMARERDGWGQSEQLRAAGKEPKRWHETKAATIFLLDARARLGGKTNRPVILRRTFLASRAEAYEFGQMLYAQAIRDGLLLAKEVYLVADGATWIWNMREERFPEARGTLDAYHAFEHLSALAQARYGDTEEGRHWLTKMRHCLREGQELKVLEDIGSLAKVIENIEPTRLDVDEKTILREWDYFCRHRDHFDYAAKSSRGIPIGSGCIESTCKQYQLRVKRCGQFWGTDNLEGLLRLHSRYLNHLWN
jgi:hypothetical protein